MTTGNITGPINGAGASDTADAVVAASAAITSINNLENGPSNPGWTSGRWYTAQTGNAFSTGQTAAGGTTIYLTPFFVNKQVSLTNIGVYGTTVGTATGVHMGIYHGAPNMGTTVSLVGSTDVVVSVSASAGNPTMFSGAFTSTITLSRGWYGLAVYPNGTITLNTLATGIMGYVLGHTDLNTAAPKIGSTGQSYGALPTTFVVSLTNDASNTFVVGVKAQ